jgi:hypothetical protein
MTELEALKERVRILEQRSRMLRNVGIGLALFVIASFAFAQQRQGATPQLRIPDVIEAKKFVLKDGKGVERGVLEFDARGTVFSLYGPDRNAQSFPAASLTTSIDKGRSKGYLTVDDLSADDIRSFHGAITAQQFIVKDENDDEKGYLDRNGLVLYKNVPVVQGKGRPFAWTNAEYFKLFDENGTERAVLGSTELVDTKTGAATKTAVSSLALFDKEGKVLFRAPL